MGGMEIPAFLTNLNTLSIIVFLLIAAAIVWRDRENIERHSIVLVRRTKHGVEFLDRVAALWPRIWKHWASVGVVIGFLLMIPMFFLILHQTVKLFLVADAVIPVQPLLPTASTFTDPTQAGYFGIPFWYFMVSISVVLVVHEMMHGVIARVEDFAVEYVGLILIAILPGAFVQPEGQKDFFEPDDDAETEKQSPWDQGKWTTRLRVLAAGPWANITLALFLAILLIAVPFVAGNVLEPAGIIENNGVPIVNVSDGSPAQQAGLTTGMLITGVNGNDTYTLNRFRSTMDRFTVGDTATIRTQDQGTFDVTLAAGEIANTNITFRPAPVDRLLPVMEQRYPGTIDTYERYNDWLVGDCPGGQRQGVCTVTDTQLEVARWEWIQSEYPALDQRAQQRIAELEPQIEEPEPRGVLGIMIAGQHERDIAFGLDPLLPVLGILFALTYIVALINLAIGTANLLPVKGLDGGWMLSILLDRFVPDRSQRISRIVTVITLLLIGISFAFFLARIFL